MYKEFRIEIEKLKVENQLLTDLLSNYIEEGNITPGCRVKIEFEDGKTQEGRVIKFSEKQKHWLINRDGYVETIGVPDSQIKLVYHGIENLIDIKNWENGWRLKELEEKLKYSELPDYLKDKDYVNILVVGTKTIDYTHHFIDFQIYNYEPVLRVKVLNPVYQIGQYYQLQISDGDIFDIRPISKERYLNKE